MRFVVWYDNIFFSYFVPEKKKTKVLWKLFISTDVTLYLKKRKTLLVEMS